MEGKSNPTTYKRHTERGKHGGAEDTKTDRGVMSVLLIALVINVLINLANHYFVMK